MRPTGNWSPALDDRDIDLVAFALPQPETPPVELIADSPLGEVRTWLVTTKEKTMKTRQEQRLQRDDRPLQEPLAVGGGGPVAQPDAAAEDHERDEGDLHRGRGGREKTKERKEAGGVDEREEARVSSQAGRRGTTATAGSGRIQWCFVHDPCALSTDQSERNTIL